MWVYPKSLPVGNHSVITRWYTEESICIIFYLWYNTKRERQLKPSLILYNRVHHWLDNVVLIECGYSIVLTNHEIHLVEWKKSNCTGDKSQREVVWRKFMYLFCHNLTMCVQLVLILGATVLPSEFSLADQLLPYKLWREECLQECYITQYG